jgi:hypothetical protein
MQDEKIFHIYEGSFGSALARDGFGLQGAGRLFINAESGTLELSGERSLPMLISLPLAMLPLGRVFRTLRRTPATYAFPVNRIKDLAQEGRIVRFRAPQDNASMKQTRFNARSEAQAQEIFNTINRVRLMHDSRP